jgi:putative transposase
MPDTDVDRLIVSVPGTLDALTEVFRAGAQRLLAGASEVEVGERNDGHRGLRDEFRHRQVVRNGRPPNRTILTGFGPLAVEQPRVHDRRPKKDEAELFSSKVLPRYSRKTKSLEELPPWLYLKGISTGDFSEALPALVGPQAKGRTP